MIESSNLERNGALSNWLQIVISFFFVLCYEAALPLLAGLVAGLLLFAIPQAQEVLAGLLGPAARSYAKVSYQTAHQRFVMPIGIFFFSTLVLSGTNWYTARLLVTVGAEVRRPAGLAGSHVDEYMRAWRTWVPRFIGCMSCSFAIAAFLSAQRINPDQVLQSDILALAACVLPLAYFVLRRRLRLPAPWDALAWFTVLAIVSLLVMTIGIDIYVNWVNWLMWAAPALPTVLLAALTARRSWLEKISRKNITDPADSIPFSATAWKLAAIAASCTIVLISLAMFVGLAREAGSASIVLLFLASITGLLAAALLYIRHLSCGTPGTAWFVVAVIVLIAFVAGEPLGDEAPPPTHAVTEKASEPERSNARRDIVVNAYGGGLRAAVFTAIVLANLDDRSCGEFGDRLHSVSSVSGGSLGVGTYLIARQEFVHANGGKFCRPSKDGSYVPLTNVVSNALLRDHLSPALARLLTFDLLPGHSATRGQALMNSWQEGVEAALAESPNTAYVSSAGFALPLQQLNGGLSPGPRVFFNTTNVDTGKRVWFSNDGTWAEDGSQPHQLSAPLSVGQVILHSARFPVISPAGEIDLDNQELRFVDGGYADNSGATTLIKQFEGDEQSLGWIDLNGNAPDTGCATNAEPDVDAKIWTGLEALLKVRESQADIAIDHLKDAHKNWIFADARFDINAAYSKTYNDDKVRCMAVKRLRSAPLGWYMTFDSYEPMHTSMFDVVAKLCEKLSLSCVRGGKNQQME